MNDSRGCDQLILAGAMAASPDPSHLRQRRPHDNLARRDRRQIPFAEAAKGMNETALSFYGESKRVRNDRLKRELNVTLRYPTFREGLRALFATEKTPTS